MSEISQETSHYERQNAMISYCFLGIFILLSRQERFQSRFVNSHARVATLIQFLFLVLIIMTIYSGNFGSMLIFDFSISNIAYFIGFFTLLITLGMGMISALLGKTPKIHIQSLSLKEITQRIGTTDIQSIEKIPMILSHIPIIGNLIAAKYGSSFYSGERFATWTFLVSFMFFWIDQSMTLLIIFVSVATLWIIYQSISLFIDGSISLIGEHLPTSREVHIFFLTFLIYTRQLISHTHGGLPHWGDIATQVSQQYPLEKNEIVGEIITFPIVNIVYILRNIHTLPIRSEIIQGFFITLACTISILTWSPSWILFILFVSYTGFLSLHYQHIFSLPFIKELSSLIINLLTWLSKKSKKETISFTS